MKRYSFIPLRDLLTNEIIGSVKIEDNVCIEAVGGVNPCNWVGKYFSDVSLSDPNCFKVATSLQAVRNSN